MIEDFEGSRTEFLKLLAEHDSPPAYVVRAQRVESVWENLLGECQTERHELLEMPRIRLAQVAHRIDHRWLTLERFLDPDMTAYLWQLYDAWRPRLRAEVMPSEDAGIVRRAIKDLNVSFTRFNRRWEKVIAQVDLSQVNYERRQYNDYYLVEKSAALGSDRLAEMGFERLFLFTQEDVLAEMPLLRVPA